MAVFVGLLVIALAWRHGYVRGKEEGVDSFLKAYGQAIREHILVRETHDDRD